MSRLDCECDITSASASVSASVNVIDDVSMSVGVRCCGLLQQSFWAPVKTILLYVSYPG